jgi:hypothetical protein
MVALLEIAFVSLEMRFSVLLWFLRISKLSGRDWRSSPFEKVLGDSDVVREGQIKGSPKASNESHIELRVHAPTLMFLYG